MQGSNDLSLALTWDALRNEALERLSKTFDGLNRDNLTDRQNRAALTDALIRHTVSHSFSHVENAELIRAMQNFSLLFNEIISEYLEDREIKREDYDS